MNEKTKKELNIKSLSGSLLQIASKLQRYSVISFVVFIALVYGFVVLRINTLSSAEPSRDQIEGQFSRANTPKINEDIAEQLTSLQDNSVSVKALFEETRNNPFQQNE